MMYFMSDSERTQDVLVRLNKIGAGINRLAAGDSASLDDVLQLIVESATSVAGGASATLYTYDPATGEFDTSLRVAAGPVGDPEGPGAHDEPRARGLGRRALEERRPVLSYEEQDLELHPAIAAAGARSGAAFPLRLGEQLLGVLYVFLSDERHFEQVELLALENFVNQAASALYHARRLGEMQRDLARKDDELDQLRSAGLLISSRLRLEETLEAILQMALEVTGAGYGIFRLVDESGQNLVTRAVAGALVERPATEPLPVNGASIMSWVAQHRQPLLVSDLHTEPWSSIYYPLDRLLIMRSELAVPLLGVDGRLEGVLNLESPLPGAFSDQDRHLLQSLATQATVAIQQARLLDALQDIAARLLLQPVGDLLQRLVELANELLNSDMAAVWVPEGEHLVLRALATRGARRDATAATGAARVHVGDLPWRQAAAHAPDIVPQPVMERLRPPGEWISARGVRLAAGPALEAVGVLALYSRSSQLAEFLASEWDKKVLASLVHYAALALLNATRQEALRVAQEQRAVAETFAAMGDVAANLLHNLNNKVGTIPVRVEGIQDKCAAILAASPYLEANLSEIDRSAGEAMEAVRESLSLLRPIQVTAVNVAEAVREAAAGLPQGVVMLAQGLDDLPPVAAGHHSLVLVIGNLLQNAADALNGSGQITIGGRWTGAEVELIVTDDGPGIPPELHERVFEFDFSGRQAANAGKLGFGLWWVKTLVARLGGSVQVQSDGLRGTAFHLRLPVTEPLP